MSSDDALVLEGLSLRYGRRAPRALDLLSCRFPRGAICGLVGPNGAGKTSLFSVISGFLPPDAGTVDILGGGGFCPKRLKGRLGVLPQAPDTPMERRGDRQGYRPRADRTRSVFPGR